MSITTASFYFLIGANISDPYPCLFLRDVTPIIHDLTPRTPPEVEASVLSLSHALMTCLWSSICHKPRSWCWGVFNEHTSLITIRLNFSEPCEGDRFWQHTISRKSTFRMVMYQVKLVQKALADVAFFPPWTPEFINWLVSFQLKNKGVGVKNIKIYYGHQQRRRFGTKSWIIFSWLPKNKTKVLDWPLTRDVTVHCKES